MEPISIFTGFLIGAFTGAAGAYLADKYTDIRRDKESRESEDVLWQDVRGRFPNLIERSLFGTGTPSLANNAIKCKSITSRKFQRS
jgi:hypothetical protein